MKIRQGFVSNSSTTSFCIYGAKANNLFTKEQNEWNECDKMGLTYHCNDYNSCSWVGLDWSSIRDNENGAQFKARVEAKLFKLGIKPEECGTFEEAWRDG